MMADLARPTRKVSGMARLALPPVSTVSASAGPAAETASAAAAIRPAPRAVRRDRRPKVMFMVWPSRSGAAERSRQESVFDQVRLGGCVGAKPAVVRGGAEELVEGGRDVVLRVRPPDHVVDRVDEVRRELGVDNGLRAGAGGRLGAVDAVQHERAVLVAAELVLRARWLGTALGRVEPLGDVLGDGVGHERVRVVLELRVGALVLLHGAVHARTGRGDPDLLEEGRAKTRAGLRQEGLDGGRA